ncbi:Phosphatidic acid phosphatase [Phytophthora megakarya]|uniref:Phosphatidic acid phosphatase n=1 Tax=Phytophthora megakarya TaxID=4795 RepID=A0A225VXW4_9STRA|nr:Phosphatidic acid phosphatase [Phytophthora megakarya]
MKDYRILDFVFTGFVYLIAFVCSIVEVHERPIPGIRYRLNSTAVAWGLDPSIDKVKLAEEVPMWLAIVLGIGLPASINLIVNFVLPKFCQVRIIAHDTRDFLLSLFQAMAFASLFTQFTKNIIGRFRPSFYSMCKWNYDVVWDGVTNLCTDAVGEKEGRKSFPSGHASCSWATMLTLSLYLLGRFRLNNPNCKLQHGRKTLVMAFCCLPLLLAVWICVTRSTDNWHHYSDILAGSVIGAGAAIVAFSSNYGSVFSWDFAGLPIETIHEHLKVIITLDEIYM